MIKIIKKIDNFLDRKWKEVCSVLFYLAGTKVEDDVDWLNMHNNMVDDEQNNKS